jgi:WD40 repeat protein
MTHVIAVAVVFIGAITTIKAELRLDNLRDRVIIDSDNSDGWPFWDLEAQLDQKLILAVSEHRLVIDGRVRKTQCDNWTYKSDRYAFIAARWSGDDIELICDDAVTRRWSPAKGTICDIRKHKIQPSLQINFTLDRNCIVSSSVLEKTISLMHFQNGSIDTRIESPFNHPRAWFNSNGGCLIIAGTREMRTDYSRSSFVVPCLGVFDIKSSKMTEIHHKHSGYIDTFAMSPNGKLFATGCSLGDVNIYKSDTHEIVQSSSVTDAEISALAFTPDLYHLLIGTKRRMPSGKTEGTVEIWCLNPLRRLDVRKLKFEHPISLLMDSSTSIVCCTSAGAIYRIGTKLRYTFK